MSIPPLLPPVNRPMAQNSRPPRKRGRTAVLFIGYGPGQFW
ncbi:hypothetical protein HMPREF0262_02169 [Clostridium sp. ATCC 29733]|nr:hypothetical protein HMPREF0262_02169 [Clostridium sp. ATCC 29733]